MLPGWAANIDFKHWDNILSTCCYAEGGGRKPTPINSYMSMLPVVCGVVFVCPHHTMTCFVSHCLPCIHPLMNPQIKEEKTPVVTAVPPPPLSVVPGGFLKQLVRDSEKETKQKEPEVKEEKPVSRIEWCQHSCRTLLSELLSFIPPAAKQAERQPRAAVPPPRSDSSDPRGRDVPTCWAAD